MSAFAIIPPFPVFTGIDGEPLDSGKIYVGVANLDPVTNPVALYWDDALTIAAAQPIVTSGGYAVRNGTPARFFAAVDTVSITVKDAVGVTVFTAASISDITTAFSGPGGAALIGYQLDEVDSVARTVADKLDETISVLDFGAVGDGVTDDFAAITAAIATGKNMFFPYGYTFLVGDTLIPEPDTTWFGYGATLVSDSNDPVIARIETNHSVPPGSKTQISIQGLKVDGGGFDGPIIKYAKVSNINFIDCEIYNRTGAAGVGIELEEVYFWEIVRPYIYDCALHCIQGTETGISGSNQGGIYGGRVIGNNRPACVAIRFDGAQNLKIIDVDVEGSTNGLTGIQLEGCEGPQIRGCYIELWTDKAIDLSPGGNRRVVITNNFVNSGILSASGGVIHLNTAGTPNENVEVSFNRGGDLAATQTLVQIGNCSNGYEFNNDPASAKPDENIAAGSNGAFQITVLKRASAANITLAAGATTSGTVTVSGARRGDGVVMAHDNAVVGAKFELNGNVVANDTVEWFCRAQDAINLVGNLVTKVLKQ